MPVELQVADAYFRTVLGTDTAMQSHGLTGYYSEKAPNQTPTPYVIWSYMGANDVTAEDGTRIQVIATYLVRVVDKSHSYTSIQAAADRLDDLLHNSHGVALGTLVQACQRQSPYSNLEDYGDVVWVHLGGHYRVWITVT